MAAFQFSITSNLYSNQTHTIPTLSLTVVKKKATGNMSLQMKHRSCKILLNTLYLKFVHGFFLPSFDSTVWVYL